jgi:two-component system, OmpR family, sensor histidine kinase BaeS
MFQTRLNQRKIQVRFDSGDDKDIMLEGDEDCLRQLFSNLLENTVRYTESPGCLKIRGSYSGTGLIMNFEDSGPGVPEESLERLFDRLYRVDKSRSRALGGTGLGLAICKEIVENHGGTIRAENAASGGLRIEIVFPLRRETGNETKSGVTE